MQAMIRGRKTRRRVAMSREEGNKLWYEQIKPVVMQVFCDVGGDDGTMDMHEFVRWLNEEWRVLRLAQRRNSREAAAQQKVRIVG